MTAQGQLFQLSNLLPTAPTAPYACPLGHTRGGGGEKGEGIGFHTTAQGQGPLYIWVLLPETYHEGPIFLPALLRAPSTWVMGCGLKFGVFRGRAAHDPGYLQGEKLGPSCPKAEATRPLGLHSGRQGQLWKYNKGNRNKGLSRLAGPEAYTSLEVSSEIYTKLRVHSYNEKRNDNQFLES